MAAFLFDKLKVLFHWCFLIRCNDNNEMFQLRFTLHNFTNVFSKSPFRPPTIPTLTPLSRGFSVESGPHFQQRGGLKYRDTSRGAGHLVSPNYLDRPSCNLCRYHFQDISHSFDCPASNSFHCSIFSFSTFNLCCRPWGVPRLPDLSALTSLERGQHPSNQDTVQPHYVKFHT